jgi:uncharacterized protein (DUF1330 family)
MSAYLILDIDVHDPVAYEAYKRDVPRVVAKHGGEYLARGGPAEVIEGSWVPRRVVLFRFPSRQAIREFTQDPEYQPLKAIRLKASTANIVAVDGIDA